MAEFTWVPDNGATKETEYRVRKAQFGDGYSQRVGDGINTLGNTLSLTFTRDPATIKSIEDFLEFRAGSTAFTFRMAGASADIKVVCSKWSRTYASSYEHRLTATFERVYE